MPFFPGSVVEGVHFYGRRDNIDRVLACDWAWICGQRRMGKTSLLKRILRDVTERGDVPLYLDLSVIGDQAIGGSAILDALLRSNRRALANVGAPLEGSRSGSWDEAFARLAQDIAATGKSAVFLWDEAEKLLPAERNQ